jgi:hypothetical protein
MSKLYANITGCSNIIAVQVSNGHSMQLSTASVECISTSLDIGSAITIDLGYEDNHSVIFVGYVKQIELKEPERTYSIICSDYLVRAVEFFIAPTNPTAPLKYGPASAEAFVGYVLGLAGITDYSYDASGYTFAIHGPTEITLTTSYDYAKYITDMISWGLWNSSSGTTVYFKERKPYVMGGDSSIGTITANKVIDIRNGKTDKNLRNRIVVYGYNNLFAEASASSAYLPAGYYRSVVISAPQIFDTQAMAQKCCDYNLVVLNRLTYQISLSVIGDPLYIARKVITLTYPNFGINADWYIYHADHAWGRSGYTCSLELWN